MCSVPDSTPGWLLELLEGLIRTIEGGSGFGGVTLTIVNDHGRPSYQLEYAPKSRLDGAGRPVCVGSANEQLAGKVKTLLGCVADGLALISEQSGFGSVFIELSRCAGQTRYRVVVSISFIVV